MDETRATPDHGFTLIEIAIVVAIVATTVAAGVGISLASRSFAVSAAAAEFDHLLDSARTVARETQGATLAFAPDAYGDGTEVRVLVPGPNGTLVATSLPIFNTHAAIEEEQSLGNAPFAFVVHASGALGGRPGYRLGNPTTSGEVGCPASGSFHFVIRTAGTSADRFIPCRITLAATGPIALASWPPASIAPAPTPCSSGPCAPAVLPTAPSFTPACPPNFVPTPGGCVPASGPSGGSGPQYHVSAALSSPTMTISGSDDSIIASADLTNPNNVPAGTPLRLPVLIQQSTNTICTATPPGPQSSGSTFTLKAVSPGTCTVTVGADASGVPGATADSATFNVAVSGPQPTPTPVPLSCDLKQNGKCYHRIVPPTLRAFEKYVSPDIACGDRGSGPTCWYIDSIREIALYEDYSFLPPVPPTTESQELLFRIEQVDGIIYGCAPYSVFQDISATDSIPYPSTGISAPVDPPMGFGDPSIFVRINTVQMGSPSDAVADTGSSQNVGATLSDLAATIAFRRPGNDYTFTFSSPAAHAGSYIKWFPNFPGCNAPGDFNPGGIEFGYVTAQILFEIYQAISP